MCITVACGAISGFHATQSPMMARCFKSSRALLEAGGGCSEVVYSICQSTMGKVGGTLAMIVLWTVSVYLVNNKKKYFCTLFPAMFMTTVTVTYFIVAPECMGLLWSKINL